MKKNIIYCVIILMTIFQSLIIGLYNNNKENQIIEVNSIENDKDVKYIEEIEKELKIIKNLNITSYTKIDNKWAISCSIIGKKEELLNFLEKLNEYKIKEYNIIYDKENIVLNLEIISK